MASFALNECLPAIDHALHCNTVPLWQYLQGFRDFVFFCMVTRMRTLYRSFGSLPAQLINSVMFSFPISLNFPAPLRSQNYKLLVIPAKEHPLHAKTNAIIFDENAILLQLAQYKTKGYVLI
jgi:hypothetical protein